MTCEQDESTNVCGAYSKQIIESKLIIILITVEQLTAVHAKDTYDFKLP